MSAREIHLELLLGRPVCDADGRRVGSIEEVKVDTGSGEWRVAEYVTGAVGALERLASAGVGLWLVTLLGTGFAGAFTTYSAFALDTVLLDHNGRRGRAVLNVAANLLLGSIAFALGWWLGG